MKSMTVSSSPLPSHHSTTSPSFLTTTSTFIKITSLSLFFFFIFLLYRTSSFYPSPSQNSHISIFNSTTNTTTPSPPPPPLLPLRAVVERTGIIDDMGIMTNDFIIGEFDEELIRSVQSNVNASYDDQAMREERKEVKYEKFRACDESMSDYIPCLDGISSPDSSIYERHCPEDSKGLDCLVPRPKRYKLHIPWPKSRDEVWFDNVPRTRLDRDNKRRNRISKRDDKLIFPGEESQANNGADQYFDRISQMVPEIAFGRNIRIVLDINSGVANFGAYLMDRNVTTLSIGPKDVEDNQIQLALERGVPAMVAGFGAQRLPYPSQAFELIHCSSCTINWARNDGILLLEADRILRVGGYFFWVQPDYEQDDKLLQQWIDMEDITSRICWELVNKQEYVAVWRKPLNNSCYVNRVPDAKPSLCEANEDPDYTWYTNVKACITRLPENGYGANITDWPARLHYLNAPGRLFSIQMDADTSRRELYKADSLYWNNIVSGYVGAFHINDQNTRNVMDMKAGYGGFAAALLDFNVNCWIMNVVPVGVANTLPLIYDRGLIGVMHDWCEPFDTYPRTYDLLNAAGLFSVEQRRCNITNIMLEMNRILRPGGRAFIHDTTAVVYELKEIASAMGWVAYLFDSGEGPHSIWKLLLCEKRL